MNIPDVLKQWLEKLLKLPPQQQVILIVVLGVALLILVLLPFGVGLVALAFIAYYIYKRFLS